MNKPIILVFIALDYIIEPTGALNASDYFQVGKFIQGYDCSLAIKRSFAHELNSIRLKMISMDNLSFLAIIETYACTIHTLSKNNKFFKIGGIIKINSHYYHYQLSYSTAQSFLLTVGIE